MSRPRKLLQSQLRQAAEDRRDGMSWRRLSIKYKCAINTIRRSLAEYSDEFTPNREPRLPKLDEQMSTAFDEIEKIKRALQTHFNVIV